MQERFPITRLLLRPLHAVVLMAGLAAGVLLAVLTPQPHLTALAQDPGLWCGDGICSEEIGEAYYKGLFE